jgi:hypothetical protein
MDEWTTRRRECKVEHDSRWDFILPRTKILVEDVGRSKHILHSDRIAWIPNTNITIERIGITEHQVEKHDILNIPRRNRHRIERHCTIEHSLHGSRNSSIPRHFTVKRLGSGEHPRKVVDVGRIKTAHITVEVPSTLKHACHRHDLVRIPT